MQEEQISPANIEMPQMTHRVEGYSATACQAGREGRKG